MLAEGSIKFSLSMVYAKDLSLAAEFSLISSVMTAIIILVVFIVFVVLFLISIQFRPSLNTIFAEAIHIWFLGFGKHCDIHFKFKIVWKQMSIQFKLSIN